MGESSQNQPNAGAQPSASKAGNGHSNVSPALGWVTFSRDAAADVRLLAPALNTQTDPQARRALRLFHLTGDAGALQAVAADVLPVMLEPFRGLRDVRHDYPLLIDGLQSPVPLLEALHSCANAVEGQLRNARMVRDNLPLLVSTLRPDSDTGLQDARPAVLAAGSAMRQTLGLATEHDNVLENDIERVTAALSSTARLLPHGHDTHLHLALHMAQESGRRRRAHFVAEVSRLRVGLRNLLNAEHQKSPAARKAESLTAALGETTSKFVNAAALSEVLGQHRGAQHMPEARLKRIEGSLEVLDLVDLESVFGEGTLINSLQRKVGTNSAPELKFKSLNAVLESAAQTYDEMLGVVTGVVRAVRVARLEMEHGFDEALHGPLFDAFGSHALSPDELLLVPPIFVAASTDRGGEIESPKPASSADATVGGQLHTVSRFLRAGRPIKLILETDPTAHNLGEDSSTPPDEARLELGYWAMSHRGAVVHQGSATHASHLHEGLLKSLECIRPGLHIVPGPVAESLAGVDGGADGDQAVAPELPAWISESAMVESRAHPLFLYLPDGGKTWAERFSIAGNPQQRAPWCHYGVSSDGDELPDEIAFTFAAAAWLGGRHRQQFVEVPLGTLENDCLDIGQWLQLAPHQAARHVPTLWMGDAEHRLCRIAISAQLAARCRDRADFWRTLQELGGVHNAYVEAVEEKSRRDFEQQLAQERESLGREHADEVRRVAGEAASDAMQRLAQRLLSSDADLNDLLAVSSGSSDAPHRQAQQDSAPPSEAAAEAQASVADVTPAQSEDDDDAVEEAYVDSALCTTCNDCTTINAQQFVYNEDKQATIGDASAGTFAELVRAAEKCPSACIHPGTPLDPGEPGLSDLTTRAAKYN